MLDEGKTGFLIDPMNPDMISERLERLLRDDPMRARMSALARQNARLRWHPEAVAAPTVALYRG